MLVRGQDYINLIMNQLHFSIRYPDRSHGKSKIA
mgnify:CR=1 FL=1